MNFLLIVQCWSCNSDCLGEAKVSHVKFTRVQVDFIERYNLYNMEVRASHVISEWHRCRQVEAWYCKMKCARSNFNVCNRRYHLWHVKLLHGGKMDGWLRRVAIHQFCCEMVIYIYVLDLVSFTGAHQACFLITHHNQRPAEVRRRKTMEREEGIPAWRSEFFRNGQSALSAEPLLGIPESQLPSAR